MQIGLDPKARVGRNGSSRTEYISIPTLGNTFDVVAFN